MTIEEERQLRRLYGRLKRRQYAAGSGLNDAAQSHIHGRLQAERDAYRDSAAEVETLINSLCGQRDTSMEEAEKLYFAVQNFFDAYGLDGTTESYLNTWRNNCIDALHSLGASLDARRKGKS